MRNLIIGVVVFLAVAFSNPTDKDHLRALNMDVNVDSGETRGSERGLTYRNYYVCSAMTQLVRESKREKLLSVGAIKIVIPLAAKKDTGGSDVEGQE